MHLHEPTLVVHPQEVIRKEQIYTQPQLRHGFWRAVVVDNRDPLGLFRVRVWIPQLHGNILRVKIAQIKNLLNQEKNRFPWAWPVFRAFAQLFGPPKIGQGVWVAFELGDPEFPVYFGDAIVLDPEKEVHSYVAASLKGQPKPETVIEQELCKTTPSETTSQRKEKETGAPEETTKQMVPQYPELGNPIPKTPEKTPTDEPEEEKIREERDRIPGIEIPRYPPAESKHSYTKETGVRDKGAGTHPSYKVEAQPSDFAPNIFRNYEKTLLTIEVKLLKWQNIIRKEWGKVCAGQIDDKTGVMLNRYAIEKQRLNVWYLTETLLSPLLEKRKNQLKTWEEKAKKFLDDFQSLDEMCREKESEIIKETNPTRKALLQRELDKYTEQRHISKEESDKYTKLYNSFEDFGEEGLTKLLEILQTTCSYDESILQHLIYPDSLEKAFDIMIEYLTGSNISIHTLYENPKVWENFAQSALNKYKIKHHDTGVGFREVSNIKCILGILMKYYIGVYGILYNVKEAIINFKIPIEELPERTTAGFIEICETAKKALDEWFWRPITTFNSTFSIPFKDLKNLKGSFTVDHYNILTFLIPSQEKVPTIKEEEKEIWKHFLSSILNSKFPKFSTTEILEPPSEDNPEGEISLSHFFKSAEEEIREKRQKDEWYEVDENWPNEYRKLRAASTEPYYTFLLQVIDASYQAAAFMATKKGITGKAKSTFIEHYSPMKLFGLGWNGNYHANADSVEMLEKPSPSRAQNDGPIFLPIPGPHSTIIGVTSNPVEEQMKSEIVALEMGNPKPKEQKAIPLKTEAPIGDNRNLMYNKGFFKDGNSIGIQTPTGCSLRFDEKGNLIITARDILLNSGKHIYLREGEKIPKGTPIDCDRFLYLDP